MEENIVRAVACAAAAFAVGVGTFGPALSQGLISSKAMENIGKYPESANNIRNLLFVSLGFVETAAIYATLIAGYLAIFIA